MTEKTSAAIFWTALILIVGMTFMTQIAFMLRIQPKDVLEEVKAMRDDVNSMQIRTVDRFFHSEFENFLRQNPQLKPPTIRVEVIGGEVVRTELHSEDEDE